MQENYDVIIIGAGPTPQSAHQGDLPECAGYIGRGDRESSK